MTLVGAITSFFAATSGAFQNDLKRVIAYSTCSQLGYMIFACGISAYSITIFHLMNHAFFKALLFLSAGAIIHAIHDEQDMRKMGALNRGASVHLHNDLDWIFGINRIPFSDGGSIRKTLFWKSRVQKCISREISLTGWEHFRSVSLPFTLTVSCSSLS